MINVKIQGLCYKEFRSTEVIPDLDLDAAIPSILPQSILQFGYSCFTSAGTTGITPSKSLSGTPLRAPVNDTLLSRLFAPASQNQSLRGFALPAG